MKPITVERRIDAPVERVFETVAEIENFSTAIPHIVDVEFLTEQRSGVGTRFRETRLMRGKEATTELEVAEHVAGERVRMVADSHGTVWDTVFTTTAEDGGTLLTMVMDAKANTFISKLINPLIRGMVAKAVEMDMDMVKVYCEQPAP